MSHPPDPDMRRAAVGSGSPETSQSPRQQKQRYSVRIETQACLSVPLPTVVTVVLLAMGARQ